MTALEQAEARLRAEGKMLNSAEFDRLARELYLKTTPHSAGGCWALLSLADRLSGQCPQCGHLVLAGPITPDTARQMLRELELRRRELGLPLRSRQNDSELGRPPAADCRSGAAHCTPVRATGRD